MLTSNIFSISEYSPKRNLKLVGRAPSETLRILEIKSRDQLVEAVHLDDSVVVRVSGVAESSGGPGPLEFALSYLRDRGHLSVVVVFEGGS